MTKHQRYNRSAKGRARMARYDQSEKGQARRARVARTDKTRARAQRYNTSEKGRARARHAETRQIWIGARRAGYAPTPELAAAINRHIRSRVHEFKQGQSARAQAQSDSLGAVQVEAAP